jgi:hypothetical protein
VSWIAVAVAGGSILGGLITSQGAQSAADTQAAAANNAAQIGLNEFNTITQQESPYMQGGYGALGALEYGLGVPSTANPAPSYGNDMVTWQQGMGGQGRWSGGVMGYDPSSGFKIGAGGGITQLIPGGTAAAPPSPAAQTGPGGSGAFGYGSLLAPFTADTFRQYSPAYQFQKQQGMQQVLNGDEGAVGSLSGAAQKDLISFNQSLADTAFSDAFNQYQTQQGNIYNRLASLAQLGQNAAANTGAQGANLAGQVAQSVTNAGTARAAGQIGSANAWSGALSSAAPWLASMGSGGGYGGYFSDAGLTGATAGYA